MAIRERLDSLSRGELAGLVVVLVATLAGVGLWYSRSLPKPIQIAETPAPAFAQAASGSASGVPASGSPGASASPPADLIIDVTGWVRHPGVYQFQPGSRVIDAVQRAGGARDGADLTLLNLAAPLADGQQILVPKEGASASVTGVGGGTGVGGVTLVNINTADEPTLETRTASVRRSPPPSSSSGPIRGRSRPSISWMRCPGSDRRRSRSCDPR
jgi:competence protein ComEA